MKAAQAVITLKPMPKAKATITDRASQGLPKAFREKSFQDKTRRGPWPLGLQEFEAKPDGAGGQHQHLRTAPRVRVKLQQWCLGLHYFMLFSGVSVLQMLVLLFVFFGSLQMAYPGSCQSWPPSWDQLDQASTQRHCQVRRRKQVMLLTQGPSFRS